MKVVLVEAGGVSNFVGFRVDLHLQPKPCHLLHQALVESRHRPRFQRKTTGTAVARVDRKPMLHEVKIDLERLIAVRNGRRREPRGRHVQRDMPAMIDPGTLRQPNLAGDLHPPVQYRVSLAPSLEGQAWPCLCT